MISPTAEKCFAMAKACFFAFFIVFSLGFARFALAGMTSTNYQVQWDALSVGASDTQSSTSYRVRSSLDLGLSGAVLGSASYGIDGGYRGGVYDPVSTFRLYSQDISTQVGATSSTSTSVTVTSAAGFTSGDRVLLVQDEGASQLSAMGKITDISGSVITVDTFVGGAVTIDGSGGDYLYRMTTDGTALPLPDATWTTVVTGVIGWEATADVPGGYSVYLMESGDLASGLETIPDVADGTVTPGSSEYGAISSDTTLSSSTFDTQDTAITTSPQLVASQSQVTFYRRDHITLKLGIASDQPGGAYSQNLTLIFVGGY